MLYHPISKIAPNNLFNGQKGKKIVKMGIVFLFIFIFFFIFFFFIYFFYETPNDFALALDCYGIILELSMECQLELSSLKTNTENVPGLARWCPGSSRYCRVSRRFYFLYRETPGLRQSPGRTRAHRPACTVTTPW